MVCRSGMVVVGSCAVTRALIRILLGNHRFNVFFFFRDAQFGSYT